MNEKFSIEEFQEWLNKQWRGVKKCPICGSNSWTIGEKPVEVREFHGGALKVGELVYPLAALICGVCGYTLLFSAIVANLVKAGQEEAAPATGTEKSGETRR